MGEGKEGIMVRRIWGLVFIWPLILFVLASSVLASRPDCARSLDEASAALGGTFGRPQEYSTSALIPLSQLIASHKDPYLIWLHVNGQIHQREFPTPGLAQMYRTAATAADALIEHLEEKAVRPEYRPGDLFSGAAHTEELMLNPSKQPLYIRDAVLIRDGVIMVVPLLKRIEKGERPLYIPILAKGHQDLRQEDKLAAAFAAWALGRSFGRIPAQAKIFLKPMIGARTPDRKNARKQKHYEEFSINVEDHLHEVEGIHADYIFLISNPQALQQLEARRSPQLMKNPYGNFVRDQLDQAHDLSMMPFPPSRKQIEALRALGINDMRALAEIDVNSEEFIHLCVLSGASPERMKYFIAHSYATVSDTPVLLQAFDDPFTDARYIVHVDFEDMMSREYRSGVYLFGARIEDPKSRKKDRVVDELFLFSEEMRQQEMEEGWAGLLRFFKKNKLLKSGDYLISVYSHHEKTKFHQEFDILKAKLDEFSPAQRRSEYFWKDPQGEYGLLIRNKEFFRRFSDLRPRDVFSVLERIVDLYPYVLNHFSFPTYSNGLKHILDYVVRSTGLQVDYPEGWNGLESIEWASKAYQTRRQELFDQIERYNRIDVDGNLAVVRYIRSFAKKTPDGDFEWSDKSLEVLPDISRASSTRAQVLSLLERHDLLSRILGKPLTELTQGQILELEKILDRGDYLDQRNSILQNKLLTDTEREQLLQRVTHNFKDERKADLLQFFKKIHGKSRRSISDELVDSIADLFLIHRIDAYTGKTIHRMILIDRLLPEARKRFVKPDQNAYRRVQIPPSWLADLKELREKDILQGLNLNANDLRNLWYGVYYQFAFAVDPER